MKREKRKSEQIWRKTKLIVHLEIFSALCQKLKTLIHDAKEKCFHKKISDCGGDQNKLFRIVNFLLGRGKQAVYPKHTDSLSLASVFNNYFVTKIADIRKVFPDLEVHAAQLSITDFDIIIFTFVQLYTNNSIGSSRIIIDNESDYVFIGSL